MLVMWRLVKTQGGPYCSETNIRWDTVSHAYDNNYRFLADQDPYSEVVNGEHTAFIDVPADASAIYLKGYGRYSYLGSEEDVWGDVEVVIPTRRAMNVGAAVWGIDSAGLYWHPDRPNEYSPEWVQFEGGEDRVADRPIADTEDDWIYQSQRVGLHAYSCWLGTGVSDMIVDVTFHWAELDATATGQRLLDIYLEPGTPNEVVLHDIDVYELAGGRYRATSLTARVEVTVVPGVDEQLNIEFASASAAVPILSGLVLHGVSAVPQHAIQWGISGAYDDTYSAPTGNYPIDPEVWLGGDAQYHGGLRYQPRVVPQGAVIHFAHLEVTAAEDSYVQTHVAIYGHAVDNSPSFGSQGTVPNRPRTSNVIPWDIAGTEWRRGRTYRSPELRQVIQEIVDRPGWGAGNALSLLLIAQTGGTTSGPRRIVAYDGDAAQAARLVIYWTNAEDVPTATPTLTPSPTATITATPTRLALQYLPLVLRQ
jgi:hypothetical protein